MGDDYLTPEDREILNFMFAHMDMSPREVAEHLRIPLDRVRDILARDLHHVTRQR